MEAAAQLRHILMKILPAPEMVAQRKAFRISNHLEMIRDSLWVINSFVMDGSLRALEQPDVAEWMKEVGAAVEDVHNLLERILDYWKPSNEDAAERKRKMINNFFQSTSSRRSILLELQEIVCTLNYLANRGATFGLWAEMMDSMDPSHDDYAAIMSEEVMGSHEETVIKLLQEQHHWSQRDMIAIRGDEYFGKTTLARKVYHHPWVRQHFQRRIWLDASSFNDFNSNMISKEIARLLTRRPYMDLNCWKIVDEHLYRVRYLFIMDNLYSYGASGHKLDELVRKLFHWAAPGSKFIFTVYPPYEYETHFFCDTYDDLSPLPDGAWVRLLLKYATFVHPIEGNNNQKVKVSPAATNMLIQFAKKYSSQNYVQNFLIPKGMGLMFRQRDVSQWQELANELLIRHYPSTSRHFSLMHLHYWSFGRIRRFLYELLFGGSSVPGYDEDVFHILVAEGTLTYYWHKRNIDFTPLEYGVDLCFFRMEVSGASRIPRQCRHLYLPINSKNISKFKKAIEVARVARKLRTLVLHREEINEHICQIETKILESMFSSLTSLCTLDMRAIMIQGLPRAVVTLRCLRYLNLAENKIETLPESICNLYNLCVLNLSNCEKLKELPRRIHELRKLQILKLCYCLRIQKLPESIICLVNLNELDIRGCCRLSELPDDLSGMKNLMQLNMAGCAALTRMPSGIRRWINLQSLRGIDAVDGHGNVTLSELHDLRNLESLHIQHLERLELDELKSATLPTYLLKDQDLYELVLHWERWNDMATKGTSNPMVQLLEGFLRSLRELKVLRIISYMSKRLPTWLMLEPRLIVLKKLKRVELVNLRRCATLPPLGVLPQLEEVTISGFDSVRVIDDEFYGEDRKPFVFPELRKLTFSEMPRLEMWLGMKSMNRLEKDLGLKSMPRLEKWLGMKSIRRHGLFAKLEELTLIQCPKLMVFLAQFPTSSQLKLKLWLSNEMLMPTSKFNSWSNLGGINMVQIFGCQELRSLPNDTREIHNLKTLTIMNCNKLEALPIWLEQSCLESLCMYGCRALSFIPEELKVKGRLKNLIVEACPKLQSQKYLSHKWNPFS
ncbi:putative disease resistance protein RGA3 [Zingiber officinale]|uniref:putative disease resistance protein RGA3 n=1 Tax=Zingiber officinale TaxID=94328 RepID=UPI001C4D0B68|nr:putative disease resistance protein RGA3 [Zingiber officinale]